MPEVSTLMAEWPAKFEDAIRNLSLPGSQLDCSLKEYIDIICGKPVHCRELKDEDKTKTIPFHSGFSNFQLEQQNGFPWTSTV